MEIKVGDYVRSTDGLIAKIVNIEIKNGYDVLEFDGDICFLVDLKENKILKERKTRYLPLTEHIDVDKIKHSPNIIDLIEVGDYVNGRKVSKINLDRTLNKEKCILCADTDYDCLETVYTDKDIKSIVTKEQFSSMEYKIER